MPETVPSPTIRVEVAWAERDRQVLVALEVPAGTTAARAVELADLSRRLGAVPQADALGVHGRVVAPERVLVAGDRVELYRRLPVDPKETRRRLAREGRTMGRTVGSGGAPNAD
ncbi:MAG: RnfH family protein [Steroidobacteraceae bacterium]|nr:RnfH family protein [Steroidobacteraceae bacterium]